VASRHGRAYRGFFRLLESVGVKDARARWERKSPFLQRAVPPLAIAAVVLVLVLPFRTPDPAAIVFLAIVYALYIMPPRWRKWALPATVLTIAVLYPFLVQQLDYQRFLFEIPIFSHTGYHKLTENPWNWFTGMFLAWMALGIFGCTQYTRYTRGAMVEALNEDYIRTAKAKGLASRAVVYRHGLRAALVPVVTIFGIDFATLLAGTIITERIFDIQGIGWWGLEAVRARDLSVVAATTLFGAVMLIVANLIVDMLYSVLDPRVRLS